MDNREESLFIGMGGETEGTAREDDQVMLSAPRISTTAVLNSPIGPDSTRPAKRPANDADLWAPSEDEEEALLLAHAEQSALQPPKKSTSTLERTPGSKPLIPNQGSSQNGGINEGMIAALAMLRKQ